MSNTARTIEDRLHRLELHNRLLMATLLMVLTALLVAATGDPIPDVVKARAFHVVAKDGTPLVKLEDTAGYGVGLVGTVKILNRNGQDLVSIDIADTGAGMIKTKNGKGQDLVSIGTLEDGTGVIAVFDPRGIEARGVLTTRP